MKKEKCPRRPFFPFPFSLFIPKLARVSAAPAALLGSEKGATRYRSCGAKTGHRPAPRSPRAERGTSARISSANPRRTRSRLLAVGGDEGTTVRHMCGGGSGATGLRPSASQHRHTVRTGRTRFAPDGDQRVVCELELRRDRSAKRKTTTGARLRLRGAKSAGANPGALCI